MPIIIVYLRAVSSEWVKNLRNGIDNAFKREIEVAITCVKFPKAINVITFEECDDQASNVNTLKRC